MAVDTCSDTTNSGRVTGQEVLGKMAAFFAASSQNSGYEATATAGQTVSRLEDSGNLISIGKTVISSLLGGGSDTSKNGLMSRFHPDLFDEASTALGYNNRALEESAELAQLSAQHAEEYGRSV